MKLIIQYMAAFRVVLIARWRFSFMIDNIPEWEIRDGDGPCHDIPSRESLREKKLMWVDINLMTRIQVLLDM